MRQVIIGEGDDGRSRVVEVKRLFASGQRGIVPLWATHRSPPEIPVPRRVGVAPGVELRGGATGAHAGMSPEPGGSRWFYASFEPGRVSGMHRTDTIDYDIVISGEVTIVLEVGEMLLGPGEAVIIPGVAHGWRAGPQGCTLSVIVLGLAALD